MKLLIKFSFFAILATLLISSCDDDIFKEEGATVKVTITDGGKTVPSFVVHMFGEQKGPSTAFFESHFADKSVATDDSGVAEFSLQPVHDLNAVSEQTTLYFATFSNKGTKYKAVTIKKGETKNISIEY